MNMALYKCCILLFIFIIIPDYNNRDRIQRTMLCSPSILPLVITETIITAVVAIRIAVVFLIIRYN